ncbi:dTDP-4-dehydrorhamnose reductase [Luteimonas aestuarii]|uniref:dTDP-4-dehydrorhamnose reductase n=1 Tax=Luteimonas aestuarii TaxID=453837 RepID=A0A4R5U1I6_9GAMM|nr:dTDP-4-dehydrorhamnose reductase [Luteimonas aestuarii]TDK27488.1 dTDP-4-dehydrorhamnose reductase [Luteimonas aestuarii]
MKLLLLGANGQVGHELRRALAPLGDVVCTTRSGVLADGMPCEMADFDQPASLPSLVERIAPDVVVNAAAYTAVDKAESDAEAAMRANADAPGAIAQACTRRGALLVHFSTDYVFDGTASRPYTEDDPTSPLGVYGQTKLAGEQAVQASGCRHMIFRTAWVYADHGRNFLLTMLRLAKERDELRVVADQVGTPTPAPLIADVTAATLARGGDQSGLWHLTASGSTTWHGFSEAIMDSALRTGLLAKVPRIIPIATAEYPTPARRPAYSCLQTTRLERDFDLHMPDWRAGLDAVMANLRS